MLRFAFPAVLLVLAGLLGPPPARAQQADTTAAPDTTTAPAVDTTGAAADSLARARPDTLAADPTGGAVVDRHRRAKQAARAAAESWLALIDAGAFDEGWTAADSTLRAGMTREDWENQGIRARHRLDTLRARRLARAQYRDSTAQIAGGAPVVILQYAAEYAKGPAWEAVVTTRRDTSWGVAGYRVVAARNDSLRVRPDTTQQAPTP
jgi:hypothetical protein